METPYVELVKKVHGLFRSRGLRLALAESCTGGLVSAALTEEEGASAFLDSSIVSYSAEAKQRYLGLGSDFLSKHGSVGEETTRAMAEAIRLKSRCDVALSVTCVAGPGTVGDNSTGNTFVAVASAERMETRHFALAGSRTEVRHKAVRAALEVLLEVVSAWH